MSALNIEACDTCNLSETLSEAERQNPVWEFMGGKVVSHMVIVGREVQGDEVTEGIAIEKFTARSDTEGALMQATLQCLTCPEKFLINGRQYK